MIFLTIIFMLSIFLLLQYQYNSSTKQTINSAEHSRNTLLLTTILPIIRTNLAFGLVDSNREYLDTIVKNNTDIIKLTLISNDSQVLYIYKAISHNKDRKISNEMTQTISDKETESLLGTIEIQFSNIYFEKILHEHDLFMMKMTIAFSFILLLMLWILQRTFMPMHQLIAKIKIFKPQQDDFQLERTSRHDEIGVIQNAIVDMIERIELYNRELYELNQTLEEKITLRTASLEEEIVKVKEQEKMLIAQSRLAAMGEMMSMIAHQWRQPLATSSLMIANYKITSMLSNKPNDSRDEILDNISDTLLYLSDTIDDFQTYFKPDKQKEFCKISKILERVKSFSKARLDNYGVSLHIECAKDIKVESYCNELVQIIMNLINNSVDAITESKSLKKDIFITCKEDNARSIIEISDTGGGIKDEILEHVFEPYFSTKAQNGTGLGLYMVKMIIDKHIDGDISVKNIEEGAQFAISFSQQDSH